MTSITWAGTRYVQEPGTIFGPQNRIQGRCDLYLYNLSWYNSISFALPFSELDSNIADVGRHNTHIR